MSLSKRGRWVIAPVVGGVGMLLGMAAVAPAATINLNFNGSDQFTPNFTVVVAGGSNNLSYSATGGIQDQPGPANGGGVVGTATASTDVTALYNGQTFSLNTGATNTISEFVKYSTSGTGTNDKALQLGFSNNKSFNGGGGQFFVAPRIFGNNTSELQTAVNGTTGTVAGSAATLTPAATNGDWLRLTFNIAETDATAGTFSYSYTVDDFGPNGTVATPTNLVTNAGTFTNAGLAGNVLTNLNAGFRYSAPSVTLNYDNFIVNAVPEPASLGLFAAGGLLLLRRRRPA